MTGERGYRSTEACRIVGCSYRMLDYWARTDLVWPSIAEANGSGSSRCYSYEDFLAARIARALSTGRGANGFWRDALTAVRPMLMAPNLRDLYLVGSDVEGGMVEAGLVTADHLVEKIQPALTGVIVLPLAAVVDDLAARVEEFAPGREQPVSA